jgi:hypothetical protein
MKLKDADLEAIVLRVTKYKLPTRIVASPFKYLKGESSR